MKENKMLNKGKFKKPKNKLEGADKHREPNIDKTMFLKCPFCKKTIEREELQSRIYVCPVCGAHHRMSARERLAMLVDGGSFTELGAGRQSYNILGFPEYDGKLAASVKDSGESEAVITGTAEIGGTKCCVFAMEPKFMMASMGTVVGEKLTALFEYAHTYSLSVTGFILSGGARMQEGILSLMQMAKVNAAVKRHSDAGLLYVPVLCDPTAGGVTASFAMCGDIIIAEPRALICFAGPRVIEQTIRQKLPAGFQTAEFLLEKGFVDAIIARANIKEFLGDMLRMHNTPDTNKGGRTAIKAAEGGI